MDKFHAGVALLIAFLSGTLVACKNNQEYPFPCHSVASCDATDLRLTFTRM